jgi:hypothetical protein
VKRLGAVLAAFGMVATTAVLAAPAGADPTNAEKGEVIEWTRATARNCGDLVKRQRGLDAGARHR